MGTRTPSHQLGNGLYVSGRPEKHKERQPTMASLSIPYTGGDVMKSGELGKMFDIESVVEASPKSPLSTCSSTGSNSGPVQIKPSGPLSLPVTGLITSDPIGSTRRSDMSKPYEAKVGFEKSMMVMLAGVLVFVIALMVVVLVMFNVRKTVILITVGGLLVLVGLLIVWNCGWRRRELRRFLRKYPDAELRGANHGQFIKVTGVVTCGSVALESSLQRTPRCVYVSTELHEYRGWSGKSANYNHRRLSWGLRHVERRVADFYISDFQSGFRALVKAGYGAKVASFVKPTTVVDITKESKDLSPSSLRWLAKHNLSSDDRIMRLEEGYIKEGSTVSVMGIVQRHDNMLIIVPSAEPISTGCQWGCCLLPTYIEGLVLTCDESQNFEVIPV